VKTLSTVTAHFFSHESSWPRRRELLGAQAVMLTVAGWPDALAGRSAIPLWFASLLGLHGPSRPPCSYYPSTRVRLSRRFIQKEMIVHASKSS